MNINLIEATDIVQETHYEPFGLALKGESTAPVAGSNKIKFQEQELQEAFDLGWYHFKWRMHSPEIGRFMALDPLAEKYNYYSPYSFSGNRVNDSYELEGLEPLLARTCCPCQKQKDKENERIANKIK